MMTEMTFQTAAGRNAPDFDFELKIFHLALLVHPQPETILYMQLK